MDNIFVVNYFEGKEMKIAFVEADNIVQARDKFRFIYFCETRKKANILKVDFVICQLNEEQLATVIR